MDDNRTPKQVLKEARQFGSVLFSADSQIFRHMVFYTRQMIIVRTTADGKYKVCSAVK